MTYDLAIIGGGPAGVAAGVYASRKRLKTIFLCDSFGGQSVVSDGIENWIGTEKISGPDLAKNLEAHLRAYASDIVDIHDKERVVRVERGEKIGVDGGENSYFLIETDKGADIYEHKGVTYCATCDGPLFSDQDVAVVGGGNAAFESAAQLLAYCKSVTLFNRSAEFRADPVTVKKVLSHPNMRAIINAELVEVHGEKFVTSLSYREKMGEKTGEKSAEKTSELVKQLTVTAIFVEIGSLPTTSFVEGLVDLDSHKHIVADPKTQRTSCEGIWAAGDCTDGLYHQNNIAAGDAVKALEDIYINLHTK